MRRKPEDSTMGTSGAGGSSYGFFSCGADGASPGEGSGLPEGFIPLRKVRALALLGRWPALEDRMPPWLPFRCMVEMARRQHDGDLDAHAWLELYRRAAQGDTAAQREMARACETGAWGSGVDIQRAFFWYYRAGLAGDEVASEEALRLKEAHDILPAAMEAPCLLYPGQWRITRDDLARGIRTHFVELGDDGFLASASLEGDWSYDRASTTLTLQHAETWRIRILGCRETTLFGRDQRMVTYIIERAAPFSRPTSRFA
jgi:hypothetical protein